MPHEIRGSGHAIAQARAHTGTHTRSHSLRSRPTCHVVHSIEAMAGGAAMRRPLAAHVFVSCTGRLRGVVRLS